MTFIDGSRAVVDFRPLLAESPGLAPLCDEAAFAKVCIAEDAGWTAEWPELDIQIGADTLWLDAQTQNAPDENTRIFARWRARNGLSLAQAADALPQASSTLPTASSANESRIRFAAPRKASRIRWFVQLPRRRITGLGG